MLRSRLQPIPCTIVILECSVGKGAPWKMVLVANLTRHRTHLAPEWAMQLLNVRWIVYWNGGGGVPAQKFGLFVTAGGRTCAKVCRSIACPYSTSHTHTPQKQRKESSVCIGHRAPIFGNWKQIDSESKPRRSLGTAKGILKSWEHLGSLWAPVQICRLLILYTCCS